MANGHKLDDQGREITNPVPMEPPVGYNRSPSIAEQIRSMVQSEALAQAAAGAGAETFEEADDFDVPDDPVDPTSPWENEFDPSVAELINEGKKAVAAKGAPESWVEDLATAMAKAMQSQNPNIAPSGGQSKPGEPLKPAPAKPEMKPVTE